MLLVLLSVHVVIKKSYPYAAVIEGILLWLSVNEVKTTTLVVTHTFLPMIRQVVME